MVVKYDINHVAKVFERFAEMECKGKSELYYQLAHHIANDQLMLQFCTDCRERQPIPNLLFGAVHYLLLKKEDENLAAHYPSISGKESREIPYDLFRAFCFRKEEEIKDILKSKIVQTNAVNRASYLMPIISSLYEEDDDLAVIDIGTSSGLTLNYDRYNYVYEDGTSFGQGNVEIRSENKEGTLPSFKTIKQAKRKVGIDQNIIDVRILDNSLWLKGLIWPDLVDRFARIESAIEEFKRTENIMLLEAHSPLEFREIIASIPREEKLFIYHTHVLYQFTYEERKAFRAMLHGIGKDRDFNYLAVEGGSVFDKPSYKIDDVIMELTEFREGKTRMKMLGKVDAHGKWIKWMP
jgi:hypothetical protein